MLHTFVQRFFTMILGERIACPEQPERCKRDHSKAGAISSMLTQSVELGEQPPPSNSSGQ
jgi:hypothetical protein